MNKFKLVYATNNQHKLKEVQAMLTNFPILSKKSKIHRRRFSFKLLTLSLNMSSFIQNLRSPLINAFSMHFGSSGNGGMNI